jgi:alkaline phosphatase D
VLFARLDWRGFPWVKETEAPALNMDAWDGASAGRNRVMAMLAEAHSANPVVLTGDMHRACALELKRDWRDPQSACVGVEFLATSISSGGDGAAVPDYTATLYRSNPQLKFFSDQRGYTRHVVTPTKWQADFRAIDSIAKPGLPVRTAKSFVVEAGKPGLVSA